MLVHDAMVSIQVKAAGVAFPDLPQLAASTSSCLTFRARALSGLERREGVGRKLLAP